VTGSKRPPIIAAAFALIAAGAALAGCGSNTGAAVSVPRVARARTYSLSGFQPASPVAPDTQRCCRSRSRSRPASP